MSTRIGLIALFGLLSAPVAAAQEQRNERFY